MKFISEELKLELCKSHSGSGTKKVKWSDIYDSEEELINDLFNPKVFTNEDNVPMHMWCKGYEYIKSFRKYYRLNGRLTEKQMTQLKRLASEIAYCVYCI